MRLKELKEIIWDETKIVNYSSKEIFEAMEKYKRSYEILLQDKEKQIEYFNQFPTMPFDKE